MKFLLPENNSKGYIKFTFIIFAFFLAFFLIPRDFIHSKSPNSCQIGEKPANFNEIIRDLPKQIPVDGNSGEGDYIPGSGVMLGTKANYVLIRKNVPLPRKSEVEGYIFLGISVASDKTHTINLGEQTIKPGYDLHYPTWGGIKISTGYDLNFLNEHMIFFVKNTPGSVIELGNNDAIYIADIYQEEMTFNQTKNQYTLDQLFACDPNSRIRPRTDVVIPQQSPSETHKQLQLEWFAFRDSSVWSVHCKPAVYLYPPHKMSVNVKVQPAGTLIYTDPLYDVKTGWTVTAYPDGNITTSFNKQPANYPYLYFESKVRDEVIHKPTNGWVVKYSDLQSLYQDILPKLGLNSKQTQDFSDYWNKALNPAPYYFVGVIDQPNVDQIERLEITPSPDYINRVRIYFERLDSPKTVESPVLTSSQTLNNSRFNVVEWGGMVKNDPNHPFTCSQ